jgi:hypothetical protein
MITESDIMYIEEPSLSQAIRVHFAEFYIIDEKHLENIYIYRCFLNIKICSLLWEFAQTVLPLVIVAGLLSKSKKILHD